MVETRVSRTFSASHCDIDEFKGWVGFVMILRPGLHVSWRVLTWLWKVDSCAVVWMSDRVAWAGGASLGSVVHFSGSLAERGTSRRSLVLNL